MRFYKPILLLGIIIFTISLSSITNLDKTNETDINSTELSNKTPTISATAPRTVINDTDIGVSDWETMKATYTWITGDGTKNQPYIIDNVTIDGGQGGDCLKILDSNKFFEIKDSVFYNGGAALSSGIRLVNVSNGKIYSNNLSNNEDFGIYLERDCSNISIYNNILNKNDYYGIISYYDCNYINISSNTIRESGNSGILVRGNNNTRVIGNTLINNTLYGIQLRDSFFNIINSNIIKENPVGLSIYEASKNNITNNLIKNNTENGITVKLSSNNNTISGNYLYMNKVYQIEIKDSSCNGSIIEFNKFIDEFGRFIKDDGINTKINNNSQLLSIPSLDIIHQETHTNKTHFVVIIISSSINFSLFLTSFKAWWNSSELLPVNITEISEGNYNLSLPVFENGEGMLTVSIESETHSSKTYNVELFNYNLAECNDCPDDSGNDDDDNSEDSSDDSIAQETFTFIMIGFIANGVLIMIAIGFFIKSKGK
ncbi:MAG: nitrous oxide reductase family maturation protein NosD [Promethearchaeota archaeon]